MTVPGYYTCNCDKYNPDCRCHPKGDTMSDTETTMRDTQDHAKAIRGQVGAIRVNTFGISRTGETAYRAIPERLDAINRSADALAADRDALRQQLESESVAYYLLYDERDALAKRCAEAEERVSRLQELVAAEIAFSTSLVDVMDVDVPNYPTWLDNESSRLAKRCHEHGDLPDGGDR